MPAYEEHNGLCYRWYGHGSSHPEMGYNDAQAFCEREDAHLPVVDTFEKFQAVEYIIINCEEKL